RPRPTAQCVPRATGPIWVTCCRSSRTAGSTSVMSVSQPEEPGPEQNFGDSAPQPQPQPQRGASDGELPPEQSSSDTGAAGQDAEDERQRAFADPATLRRAPRYGRFAITGVILGIVACAAAVLLFAEPTEYFGLFGVFAILA